jgi:hypothetical protein
MQVPALWRRGQQVVNGDQKIIFSGLALAGIGLAVLGLAVIASPALLQVLIGVVASGRGGTPAPDLARNLRLVGWEALGVGVLVTAVAAVCGLRWPQVSAVLRSRNAASALGIGAIVLLWLPVILSGRSAVIGAERYWWLGDDAMISMRYARNFAVGLGLVWNPGERVEGYSNFLWTLYMAALHWLPVSLSKISLLVLLTNLALSMAIVPVLTRLVRLLGGSDWVALAAVAAYVLNRNILYWTSYGFETVLLSLLFLLATYRVLREAKQSLAKPGTYVLIALITLVRADALILAALLYCLSLALNPRRRAVLAYSALSLLVPLTHEVLRVIYYGDLLPNTAYLKATNWSGKYQAGIAYSLRFLLRYSPVVVLAAMGALARGQGFRRALLGVMALYAAYVAYIGGDAFTDYRFFVPLIPLLLVLALLGAQDVRWRIGGRPVSIGLAAACLVSTPLLSPGYPIALLPYPADAGNVAIGLYLRDHTAPNSRVADFWAGSVLYFSGRPGIDLLGKADPYIARLPATPGSQLPGHNKFNFEYSLGVLQPDFVVAHFKLPVDEGELRRDSSGAFAYTGLLYFDPIFQQHCWPNPVDVDTWRTVFACRWATEPAQAQ